MALRDVLLLFATPIRSCVKDFIFTLDGSLDVVFIMINFISSRAKNHRLFQLFTKGMGTQLVETFVLCQSLMLDEG